MAINYTTLLGLAQPVTGTEANTWGTVVNDEITALLDSAIAGAATLDVTAGNVTLTATAGVANQARMAILLVTGTPGTTRNIVAPSQSKIYIVVNQSNASVVLKGSATTGVTIRAGQAATCVWNGADFESVASGDVDGPSSATDTAIAIFDGTTGKLIKNTGVTIDGSNNVSGVVQLNATTLDATNLEVTNLKAKDGTAAGSIADSTGVVTLASSVLTTTDINGGTVDNTAIGATTASTVRATQVDIIAQGDLRLQDTTGGEFVALQAPGTLATSYTLTLPVDDGTSGQALITDGSGVLSWSTAASGDVYGPASATDNAIARYDGTTGKIIQNSAVTIADDGATVIDVNSTSAGLRITQVGTGNALLVEDSANPDATPFVINADGIVIKGNDTAVLYASSVTPQIQLNIAGPGTMGISRWSANTSNNTFVFLKSRGTTIGDYTSVASGDNLGAINFYGTDGAAGIQAASISSAVDGTPGTNDMPGRLVFSTTADGASSPTERVRIDNAGRVGIGIAPTAAIPFYIANTPSGASAFGAVLSPTFASTVTTTGFGIQVAPSTAAASFTCSNLVSFYATQGSLGAGSSVTNQFGFIAESTFIGATNNFGFRSNIASGTGRWNFYAAGTAANYFAGSTAIGTTTTNTGYGGVASLNLTNASTITFNNASNVWNTTTAGGAITYFTDNNLYIDAKDSTSTIKFRVNGANIRGEIAANGTWSLGAAPGSESLRVTPVASSVNYVNITGAAASGGPNFNMLGTDTDISFGMSTKGAGAVDFYSNNFAQRQFRIAHTASAVNYLQVQGGTTGNFPLIASAGSDANISFGHFAKGTGSHFFYTNSAVQFQIANTTSAVNYLQITGGATGVGTVLSAQGSDANIQIYYQSKGTFPHSFLDGSGSEQFRISPTASAVNNLRATGGATGNAPTLSVGGSDTNIDLAITPKGTGVLRFGTYTAGILAQAGYIQIKDAAGNVRNLLVG
jgi:hypothetical protein